MTAFSYPPGPESGALDSSLWLDESPRPQSVIEAERERAERIRTAGAGTPSSGATDTSAPVPAAAAPSMFPDCVCADCREARWIASGGLPESPAAPTLPIWSPDEWDMLRRIEKLEIHIANMESVLCMAVQVATQAAEIAKGRTKPEAA